MKTLPQEPFFYSEMTNGYGVFRRSDLVLVERCYSLDRAKQLVWLHGITHREPQNILERFLDAGGGLVLAYTASLLLVLSASAFIMSLF